MRVKQSMKRKVTTLKMSLVCLPSAQYASIPARTLDEKHESGVPFAGFSSSVLFVEIVISPQ